MTASTSATTSYPPRAITVAAIPAALAGAAALAAEGVLQLTGLHWGAQMLVRTLPQHLSMALFVAGMIATSPLLLAIGRRAGGAARIAAGVAITGQLLISAITTQSNLVGHDAKAFNTLAGIGMLLWLPALVVLAILVVRRRALPKLAALALVVTFPATLILATKGGGLLAAACWIGIAAAFHRGQPAARR